MNDSITRCSWCSPAQVVFRAWKRGRCAEVAFQSARSLSNNSLTGQVVGNVRVAHVDLEFILLPQTEVIHDSELNALSSDIMIVNHTLHLVLRKSCCMIGAHEDCVTNVLQITQFVLFLLVLRSPLGELHSQIAQIFCPSHRHERTW